ncbi:MAG: InlB B-repeat-containing protein, partial [Firmicutes bacterium]|nr:InlB B-repeat-containing protein [Bacillota bacterium]
MKTYSQFLKKTMAIMLSLALVFTMMPMVPGAVQKVDAATEVSVTVSASPAAGGTVALVGEPNSDGTFNYNSNVRADAEANDGYEFSGWYEDDVLVSSDIMYPFVAMEDRHLVAKFTKTKVFITATAENPEHGTAYGGGLYDPGELVELFASPEDGYKFVKWTEDGTEVSTDFDYSFTAAEDRNLVAVFEEVDQRTKVDLVEAISDVDKLLGYNNEYAYPSFTVETGAPAYFDEDGYGRYDRGYWEKKNDDETFSIYGENVFSEGTYRYMVQVRIDDDAGKTHRLTETPVIKVNGETWDSWDTANIFDYYSYTMAWSPEYT